MESGMVLWAIKTYIESVGKQMALRSIINKTFLFQYTFFCYWTTHSRLVFRNNCAFCHDACGTKLYKYVINKRGRWGWGFGGKAVGSEKKICQ